MLNGIDPILIFHLWKLTPTELDKVSKIPLVSSVYDKIGVPPIPLYLSETATGLYIDTEEKNIDIETVTDTLSSGSDPIATQKALGSTVRINMIGKRDSLGLILITAVADLILPKVTSREYGITYLHGAVTVFNGLLRTFAVSANANDDRLNVTLELSKTTNRTKEQKKVPKPEATSETLFLESGAERTPTGPLPTTSPLGGPPPTGPAGTPPPVSIGGPA